MKAFHAFHANRLTPGELRAHIHSKGYALIHDLLPQGAVRSVLVDITRLLSAANWLKPGIDPLQRIPLDGAAYGDPDPIFKQVYQQIFNLESFHSLPHHSSLRNVMRMLAGDQVLIHPKPIGRLIFPNCERLVVHAHQDYEFMRGDPEFFTVWIPLHDCPVEAGPLRILAGSHRFGFQKHARENLHVPEIPADALMGDEWFGGPLSAGDVLIFHSLTVHAASPNLSEQMRISLDIRFQDARRELNPSNLVFAGESGKSWEKTYANWQSDELKFYWKNFPLTLNPSKEKLEQLAQTAESPSARARYSRIVSQIS